MVAHEKRNSAQLFCAVPTRNDLALSSLIFSAQPTQKLEYPPPPFTERKICATIKNTITNFFAYNTKREIVRQVKDTEAFKRCYADTISCSHPCLARYNKNGSKEYPINCGYCYPCLIRKSSLLDIDEMKKYSYQGENYDFLMAYEESEKSADLRAVLGSVYRCKHSSDEELKRYIRCVGELTEEEVEKFLTLYKKSIDDLVHLFSADQRMKEYLGL